MIAADVGMAFAFHEDGIAGCGVRLVEEEVFDAAHRHDGRGREAGELEERGAEVGDVDEGIDGAAGAEVFAPTNSQGHARAGVVAVGEAARELPAVVAGVDDDGVFEFAGFF